MKLTMKLTKEQAREMLKENFEEISRGEYLDIFDSKDKDCGLYICEDGNLYFKPKQKLPIVFEDEFYRIEVFEDSINLFDKSKHELMCFSEDGSLPLLEEAINKRKELQK